MAESVFRSRHAEPYPPPQGARRQTVTTPIGSIQRAIIAVLQQKNLHDSELATLTVCALHPERFAYRGETYFDRPPDPPGWAHTLAERAAVLRAARRLERRGLVRLDESGGRTVVSLAVVSGDERLRM